LNVHYLFALPLTVTELTCFHLASVRLRFAVARVLLIEAGFSVSIGEEIPAETKVLIVPKIGADDISRRSPRWLTAISGARERGVKVILDYTDHHLGFASPMRAFYESAIRMCDLCVVPSAYLKMMISTVQSVATIEIVDALEYPILPVRPQMGAKPAVLWFGHSTNFSYLVDFLHKHDLSDYCTALTIVSSKDVVKWVYENRHLITVNNIEATPWSVDALQRAALQSDIVLIPQGLRDARKAGASSNRLVTSLALGLPVITQSIASYREYRSFYADIDEDDFLLSLKNPMRQHEKVREAQATIVPNFDRKKVGELWVSVIQNITG
jgi:hypothetical protein